MKSKIPVRRSTTRPSCQFVQDSHSKSAKNVLLELHYQIQNPQGKLLRVVQREVFDVAVDLRKSSKAFGLWLGVHLSVENKKQLWVPEGVVVELNETAEVERRLLWSAPALRVDWQFADESKLAADCGAANSLC